MAFRPRTGRKSGTMPAIPIGQRQARLEDKGPKLVYF